MFRGLQNGQLPPLPLPRARRRGAAPPGGCAAAGAWRLGLLSGWGDAAEVLYFSWRQSAAPVCSYRARAWLVHRAPLQAKDLRQAVETQSHKCWMLTSADMGSRLPGTVPISARALCTCVLLDS
jgi:hypothetical protein